MGRMKVLVSTALRFTIWSFMGSEITTILQCIPTITIFECPTPSHAQEWWVLILVIFDSIQEVELTVGGGCSFATL